MLLDPNSNPLICCGGACAAPPPAAVAVGEDAAAAAAFWAAILESIHDWSQRLAVAEEKMIRKGLSA